MFNRSDALGLPVWQSAVGMCAQRGKAVHAQRTGCRSDQQNPAERPNVVSDPDHVTGL
jgi:hypothetical protein